jgi:hypothetical protein
MLVLLLDDDGGGSGTDDDLGRVGQARAEAYEHDGIARP